MKVSGRRVMVLAAPAIAVAMAAAGCGSSTSSTPNTAGGSTANGTPKQGGTLRYGADQAPTGFNPNTSADNGTAAANVVGRILPSTFFVTPDFKLQWDSDLLTSEPQATTVNGKQVVTYKLNPAAAWSDGVPINSDDFEYLWKSTEGKGYDVASTVGYDNIASVKGEGADKKTVVVTFAKPYGDWRSLFSAYIVPAHYMKAQESKLGGASAAWSKALKTSLPVSGGPWAMKSYDQTTQVVTLVPNTHYWGKKPFLDSIVYQTIADSTQQPTTLKNNEVDMLYPQPQLDLVKQINRLAPAVTSQISFGLSFEHLDLNTQNQFLSDVNVRRAIAYGLDRDAIVKAGPAQFDSRAQVLNNRIWMNNQPQYKDNSGDYKSRNLAKAKSLLQQSGYTFGSDGYATKGGKALEVRFSTTAGNKLRENTGLLIQAQLKEVGIKVDIQNVKSTQLFGDRLPGGNFDMALFAWTSAPFATANYSLYHSATPQNRQSNYVLLSDPRVDNMATQANGELDQSKLADDYNQIDSYLWDDMATIPLYQKPTYIAYRSTYGGIADNASNFGPLWDSDKFYKK